MDNNEITNIIGQITVSGREFMELVGTQSFDFFDDGIVAGSGNYGDNMAAQAADYMGKSRRSMGGIMSRLLALGLWTTEELDGEKWWELTELGAAVANHIAGKVEDTAEEVEVAAKNNSTMTRKECLAVLEAAGYDGPTSYLMPKLRDIVASVTA